MTLLLHYWPLCYLHLFLGSNAICNRTGWIFTQYRMCMSQNTCILPSTTIFVRTRPVWKVWGWQEQPHCFDGLCSKPLLRRCPGTGPERACSEPSCRQGKRHSINKSMGEAAAGCQMLHMTFLALLSGLCDSKYTQCCWTCEKCLKIGNIYSRIPKCSL